MSKFGLKKDSLGCDKQVKNLGHQIIPSYSAMPELKNNQAEKDKQDSRNKNQ
jgi:hypothetical protein